jgi:D-sedoheptulose 7-phosphate isomerase
MADDSDRTAFARDYLDGLRACLDALPIESIARMMALVENAYDTGKQVFVLGNGGSAATASHMASDLGKTVLPRDRPDVRRMRVMSLTDNVAWMTAIGNDIGYASLFAEQLENWVAPGDLVIVISGSGESPNILEAIRRAKVHGATVLGLLGFEGGAARTLVDEHVLVQSSHYGFVEDVHVAINHLVTKWMASRIASDSDSEPRPQGTSVARSAAGKRRRASSLPPAPTDA